jgi:twitching motility two-component system response regulator PilG
MVGSSAYLTKPFSKDSLLAAVREHVSTADSQ